MRGTVQENIRYCTKDDTYDVSTDLRFLHNCRKQDPPRQPRILAFSELLKWQVAVDNVAKTIPNDRRVYWIYETIGAAGKSRFATYLCHHYNCLSMSGKAADIKFGVVNYKEKVGSYPDIVVVDIPRSVEWGDYSWAAIESIKDGSFYSTKYESVQVIMPNPHVFIFSNSLPDQSVFSSDRWSILKIVLDDEDRELIAAEKDRQQLNDFDISLSPGFEPRRKSVKRL
jgi:hypothetical protein